MLPPRWTTRPSPFKFTAFRSTYGLAGPVSSGALPLRYGRLLNLTYGLEGIDLCEGLLNGLDEDAESGGDGGDGLPAFTAAGDGSLAGERS